MYVCVYMYVYIYSYIPAAYALHPRMQLDHFENRESFTSAALKRLSRGLSRMKGTVESIKRGSEAVCYIASKSGGVIMQANLSIRIPDSAIIFDKGILIGLD